MNGKLCEDRDKPKQGGGVVREGGYSASFSTLGWSIVPRRFVTPFLAGNSATFILRNSWQNREREFQCHSGDLQMFRERKVIDF